MSFILNFLLDGDHNYFVHINQQWTNTFFDGVMPYITDPHKTWPYIALSALYMIYFKRAKALGIILGCLIAVGIADLTAARLIKPLVHRPRPEFVEKHVRLLVPSQASPGFPSNHASNMFAAATFLICTFPSVGLLYLFMAFWVAYSRIYVGVHFPLDVTGGAILGFFCALIVFRVYLLVIAMADPVRRQPIEPNAWEKRKFKTKH